MVLYSFKYFITILSSLNINDVKNSVFFCPCSSSVWKTIQRIFCFYLIKYFKKEKELKHALKLIIDTDEIILSHLFLLFFVDKKYNFILMGSWDLRKYCPLRYLDTHPFTDHMRLMLSSFTANTLNLHHQLLNYNAILFTNSESMDSNSTIKVYYVIGQIHLSKNSGSILRLPFKYRLNVDWTYKSAYLIHVTLADDIKKSCQYIILINFRLKTSFILCILNTTYFGLVFIASCSRHWRHQWIQDII